LILTNREIKLFACYYLGCFLICYGWYFFHHLLFVPLAPIFFVNQPDISLNILLLTNIQHVIIANKEFKIFMDLSLLILPILLFWVVITQKSFAPYIALLTCVYCWFYCVLLSTMSQVSSAMFIAWFFIPLIFCGKGIISFYYKMNIVRLLFLLFFFSSAVWKIRNGGIFNIEEMSAILVREHISYLTTGYSNYYSRFILFLIAHKYLSYAIYLSGFIIEFSFVIGFFTKKIDNLLCVLFCIFLLGDYLLMSINYSTWVPFLGCLYFSKYKIVTQTPVSDK